MSNLSDYCLAGPGRLVECASAWYSEGRGFNHPAWEHSFVETGHEIISTVILSRATTDSSRAVVSCWQKDVH